MSQINWHGQWLDLKMVHVRAGGAWRECDEMFVRAGGAWRSAWVGFDGTIYDEGTEHIDMVAGYADGNGSTARYSSYLQANALADWYLNSTASWVHNEPVDITNYSTAYIDWYSYQFGNPARIDFVLSTNKMGTYMDYTHLATYSGNWARRIDSFSISSYSGNQYLRAHVTGNFGMDLSYGQSNIRIYKLWVA